MILTVVIPANLWMSANRSPVNHGHKARIVRDLQTLTRAAAHGMEPVPTPATALWTIRYPKGTGPKSDPPNAYPTTKAILDAVVDAGLIHDDNAAHITRTSFERGPNLDQRGAHLIRLELVSA